MLFQGCFLIPGLLARPRHARTGPARAQMATDGESDVPLQIEGLGNKELFVGNLGTEAA